MVPSIAALPKVSLGNRNTPALQEIEVAETSDDVAISSRSRHVGVGVFCTYAVKSGPKNARTRSVWIT